LDLDRVTCEDACPMRVEHIAFQVKDPLAVVDWYVRNFGFRVVRAAGGPAQTHFLADVAGHVVLEIYSNPAAPIPDYVAMNPLVLHLAFAVENVAVAQALLVKAGATVYSPPEILPSGDELAMLRDPFGLAIQLARRKSPLLPELA
jgi:glyoxylase I family protein